MLFILQFWLLSLVYCQGQIFGSYSFECASASQPRTTCPDSVGMDDTLALYFNYSSPTHVLSSVQYTVRQLPNTVLFVSSPIPWQQRFPDRESVSFALVPAEQAIQQVPRGMQVQVVFNVLEMSRTSQQVTSGGSIPGPIFTVASQTVWTGETNARLAIPNGGSLADVPATTTSLGPVVLPTTSTSLPRVTFHAHADKSLPGMSWVLAWVLVYAWLGWTPMVGNQELLSEKIR